MLWAAFLTCFFGFFRSGEICSNLAEPSLEFCVDSLQETHRIQIGQIKNGPIPGGYFHHSPVHTE